VKWSALLVDNRATLSDSTAAESKDKRVEVVDTSRGVTVGSNYDWIGFYRLNSSDPRDVKSEDRITWMWIPKSSSTADEMLTGIMQFAIPTSFGHFVFLYFSPAKSGEYVRVATSNVVTVGPVYRMTAQALPDESKSEMSVAVRVSQLSGLEYSTAWIGMYEKSQTDHRQYKTFEWLTSGKVVDMNEKTKTVELQFKASKSGDWEFRLFPLRAYTPTTTATLTLSGSDSVQISVNGVELTVHANVVTVDPLTEYVWVGVYKVDETNNRQWRRYQYILEPGKTSMVFKTPIHTGIYEARLFAHKSYTILLRSNPVAIQGI